MSKNQLLNLVLDLVTLSPSETMALHLSFDHFKRRVRERNIIIANFQQTGGRLVSKFGQRVDSEEEEFTTSVQHTELSRKLVINVEKDFSDSKVDIKVYETRLLSRPEWLKIQIEIFQVEDPSLVFRCDYLSTTVQNGRQLLIERFNLNQKDEEQATEEEKDKVRQKAMIFTLSETCFPHQFNFMLLEPCSHIFWFYTHRDNKLNYMERRMDKQAYARILLDSVKGGFFRGCLPNQMRLVDEGF